MKLVDGTVLTGSVNTGVSRRLSDFFNKYESTFLVLFNVSIGTQDQEVLFVNYRHILWARPANEPVETVAVKGERDLKPAVASIPKA